MTARPRLFLVVWHTLTLAWTIAYLANLSGWGAQAYVVPGLQPTPMALTNIGVWAIGVALLYLVARLVERIYLNRQVAT
jgi:hypothetical protein